MAEPKHYANWSADACSARVMAITPSHPSNLPTIIGKQCFSDEKYSERNEVKQTKNTQTNFLPF